MQNLCQLPHAMVLSHNILCFIHMRKILCCWDQAQVPVPQEEEKHITFCLKQLRTWFIVIIITIIKEFNPSCQLKGIAETV